MYNDFSVSVKWQKEVFSNVEIDTTQPPYVFKCQLFDLTGVPPERQKIMVKGGLLKVQINLIKFCFSIKILNNKSMFYTVGGTILRFSFQLEFLMLMCYLLTL